MSSFLSVHNLVKYFNQHKAVDDISFSINAGTIFGLLGPNGAGKTTLIRMITGIIYPDTGDILLNQKPFNIQSDSIQIGYMPEERGLYKKMKVGEHIIYLARLRGLSYNDAMTQTMYWFKRLGMETWWNKKIQDLSKGMSQKIQFISTVVHNPSLIILDEPFSGLDPLNANIIKDIIFELSQQGKTIIFSTHRMEQVEEICSQIVLINSGKKILEGTVSNIKHQFKENIFKIEIETIEDFIVQSPAFEVINKLANNNYIIKINNGYNNNDILTYFMNQQCIIHTFQEILPSLNEIFIKLVENTHAISREFK